MTLPGVDETAVSAWLRDAVPDAEPPFTYELIAAGGSNLTFSVTDSGGNRWALRRPPTGPALESAHDMSRECSVLTALSAHGQVPVPNVVAQCTDPAITGAGFYVMEFVDGTILRTSADGAALTSEQAEAATASLVDTQIRFHTIDLAEAGLADLGRHHGYAERQLRRWRRQVEAAGTPNLPLITELHDRLTQTVPPERARPALAHGDYRFDNCVLGPDHRVLAVLDWELCTTGDPIADFAWSIRYWADPDDPLYWLTDPPTIADPFPDRAAVVDRYERRSGFDLSDFGWYEVFSWWKQGCIVEGVHARRRAGSRGGAATGSLDAIAARARALLETAAERAAALLP